MPSTCSAGTKVIHCIDENNLASQGVAKKLGSYYLRRVTMPFPFENTPVDAWGQTREEWKKNGDIPIFPACGKDRDVPYC